MSSCSEKLSLSLYQDIEDSHSSHSSAETAESDQNLLRRNDWAWVLKYWETRS